MARSFSHSKIYAAIASILEIMPCKREELINGTLRSLKLTRAELSDRSVGSLYSRLRARVGAAVTEMQADGLIREENDGYYTITEPRPAVIRIERCEKEIVKALTGAALTKKDIRNKLKTAFGTDKTATLKDDERLYEYIGKVLKKMLSLGVVIIQDGYYTLAPRISAKAEDLNALLSLKAEFLHRLHSKGGEFFEGYFMSLIKLHYEKNKKEIISCSVTGGSADGGIDGIIKTRDELGFIETTMVQTKNRHEMSSETDVRGFYGAVCAKRGTRGIYATTSDFHYSANAFLAELDDCIGINGSDIFKLAIKCGYGIKRAAGKLMIDDKVL